MSFSGILRKKPSDGFDALGACTAASKRRRMLRSSTACAVYSRVERRPEIASLRSIVPSLSVSGASPPPDTAGSGAPLAMDPAPRVERRRARRSVRGPRVCRQGGQLDTAERPVCAMRFRPSSSGRDGGARFRPTVVCHAGSPPHPTRYSTVTDTLRVCLTGGQDDRHFGREGDLPWYQRLGGCQRVHGSGCGHPRTGAACADRQREHDKDQALRHAVISLDEPSVLRHADLGEWEPQPELGRHGISVARRGGDFGAVPVRDLAP